MTLLGMEPATVFGWIKRRKKQRDCFHHGKAVTVVTYGGGGSGGGGIVSTYYGGDGTTVEETYHPLTEPTLAAGAVTGPGVVKRISYTSWIKSEEITPRMRRYWCDHCEQEWFIIKGK